MTPRPDAVAALLPAVTGQIIVPGDRCMALLKARLSAFLTDQVQEDILSTLHADFHHDETDFHRCVHWIRCVAETFRSSRGVSIDAIVSRLSNSADHGPVCIARPVADDVSQAITRAVFGTIGWLTMLYKADSKGGDDALLRVDTHEFVHLPATTLDPSLVSRSILEVLRHLGEIMPTPDQQTQYHALKLASLNVATLKSVGKINVKWVDSISAHGLMDPITGEVKLCRFPSLLSLQTSSSSVLSRALENYYDQSRDPRGLFTVAQLSKEVMLSYALLFRYDTRARRLYKYAYRSGACVNGCLDPLLDELCLGPAFRTKAHPVKESFDADSDFPFLAERLLHIQDHIDGIQPNRMSSLWNDRRDILRWYTFWAVMILGGANLLIAIWQLGLAAAQVDIARESYQLQKQQN